MTSDPLTEHSIRDIAREELSRAQAMFPDWVHPFAALEFNHARRSFAQAHTDGRLVVSRSFIGTDATADLIDTLRHEFAHLIAGVRHRHGPAWKQVAAALGANTRATGTAVNQALRDRMADAPFTLLAITQSGEERVLKKVYRRSRQYLEYELGRSNRRYRVGDEWIARFRYIDHRKAGD